MVTKRILAIDISVANTGWTFEVSGPHGSSCEVGSIGFSLKTSERKGLSQEQVDGEHCIRFLKWFRQMLQVWNPDEIAIEASLVKPGPATMILLMMRGIVLMTARYRDIPVYSYHGSSIKKFALEPGYATRCDPSTYAERKTATQKEKNRWNAIRSKAVKQEMVDAAKAKGADVANDDEADAFHCLQLHKKTTA